jgi:hypothetical protein
MSEPYEEAIDDLIDEAWLRDCGFHWSQGERQPSKHWTLWCGMPAFMGSPEDIGVEVAQMGDDPRHGPSWFCWIRSDFSHRYSRFIHVRHVTTRGEVIRLVEALTGRRWNAAHHRYGRVCTLEQVERFDAEDPRLRERMKRTGQLEGVEESPE